MSPKRFWRAGRPSFTSPRAFVAAAACLFLTAGCSTVGPDLRAEHASAYLEELQTRSGEKLSAARSLTLDACIDIALKNNLAVKTAEVNATISTLEKKTAFANFLPRVQASGRITNWSSQPSTSFAGLMTMSMQDKTLRDYSVDVQMPVLMPATWLAYSLRRHGEAIGDLVAEQTRQGIALQVTAKYYECLGLLETEKAMGSQLAAAETLIAELDRLRSEGMLSEWELKQAKAGLLALRASLRETERARVRAKSELLSALGLYPLADITLESAAPFAPCETAVEDLILDALITHPGLHIADRQVAISKDQVKLAITEFLPQLAAFASLAGTSNGMSIPGTNIYGGLSGVLSVFDGFANMQGYRAAKQRRTKAYLAREEQCLSLMVQVLAAHLNERTAFDYLDVTLHQAAACRAELAAVEAQWAEGTVLASERLRAKAHLDEAQTRLTKTQHQHQLSVAVLRHAIGDAYTGS